MAFHCHSAKCQTDAQPTKLVFAAQPGELIKNTLLVTNRNSRARILHEDFYPAIFGLSIDLDLASTGVNLVAFSTKLISTRKIISPSTQTEGSFFFWQLGEKLLIAAFCDRFHFFNGFSNQFSTCTTFWVTIC